MSTPTITAAPADWYDDPLDAATSWRWWDGVQWTAHTSAKFAPAVEVLAPAPASVPAPVHAPIVEPAAYAAPVNGVLAQPASWSYEPTSAAAMPPETSQAGSPHTLGIWFLVSLPIIALFLAGLCGVAARLTGLVIPVQASWPVLVGLAVLFAALDRGALIRKGYYGASAAWALLLPPIGYLIARGRWVRAERRSAWPPELTYLGALAFAGLVALTISAASVPYVPYPAQAGTEALPPTSESGSGSGDGSDTGSDSAYPYVDYPLGTVSGTAGVRSEVEQLVASAFMYGTDVDVVAVCVGAAYDATFLCDLSSDDGGYLMLTLTLYADGFLVAQVPSDILDEVPAPGDEVVPAPDEDPGSSGTAA